MFSIFPMFSMLPMFSKLLYVLPSGMAGWNNFCSPEYRLMHQHMQCVSRISTGSWTKCQRHKGIEAKYLEFGLSSRDSLLHLALYIKFVWN